MKLGAVKFNLYQAMKAFACVTVMALYLVSPTNAATVTCTASTGFTNCTRFTYSGANQSFRVPAGVYSINIRGWGAGGGGGNPTYSAKFAPSGSGGFSTGDLAVTPGQTYTITVGRGGVQNSTATTFGGGGAGGASPANSLAIGGSGGGYSGVFLSGGLILISGGGGGASPGADIGSAGTPFPGSGGGSTGGEDTNPSQSGRGGTQTAGGLGATGIGCANLAGVGASRQGGRGASQKTGLSEGGGGGGGGYYGGGGGACQVSGTVQNGGGGGGSGYVSAGLSAASTTNGPNPTYTSDAACSGTTLPAQSSDDQYVSGIGIGTCNGNGGNGMVTIQYTPTTVKLQKTTINGTGTFRFTQTNLASTPANITTTAANTATPPSPTAIIVSTLNTNITLTELATAGFVITSASCTDTNSNITGNTGSFGTLAGNTLTIPAAKVVSGANFVCNFTNSKMPTVKLQKTTTGATGAFRFTQTNLTSTPATITTTAVNTATPASPTAAIVSALNTNVTLTEQATAGFVLTSASCTDANSSITGNTGSFGTLVGSTLTIPGEKVVLGANFMCNFTNAKIPTVKLQKITTGGTGTFSFTQTNLKTKPANITTTAVGVAAPTAPTAIAVTNMATAVTLTEAVNANFVISSASCTDANSSITGNTGSFGTLVGSTLTIPAEKVVSGANFVCNFTNAKIPTVKLQKTTSGATGTFSFTQTNLNATPANITTTAAGVATPTTPTAIAVTNIATAITITEAANPNFVVSSASCTDVNSSVTGNTGSVGTLSGNVLTIPAANVKAGAGFTCSFLNSRVQPLLSATKSASPTSVSAAGQTVTYTITVNNTGNVTLTTINVTDPLGTVNCSPSGTQTIATLNPGQAATCMMTYTLTQENFDNNTSNAGLTNTATAATTYNATAVQTTATANVTLTMNPNLSVTKSANTAGPVAAGDIITYSFIVSNIGNLTLKNINLTDVMNTASGHPTPSGETLISDQPPTNDSTDTTSNNGVWSSLAPNDAIQFTANYTVTTQDVETHQ